MRQVHTLAIGCLQLSLPCAAAMPLGKRIYCWQLQLFTAAVVHPSCEGLGKQAASERKAGNV